MSLFQRICLCLLLSLVSATFQTPAASAQIPWSAVHTNIPDNTSIFSLKFTDDSTGYAVGGSVLGAYILSTHDRGMKWQVDKVMDSPRDIPYALSFPSHDVGFAAGSTQDISYGAVRKTTDAGKHWSELKIPDATLLFAASFPDLLNGLIGGYHLTYVKKNDTLRNVFRPYVASSSDGGASWEPRLLDSNIVAVLSISTIKQGMGYALVADGFTAKGGWRTESLIGTTDGGGSWHPLPAFADSTIISNVWQVSPDLVVVSGIRGLNSRSSFIARSTDHGKTWKDAQLDHALPNRAISDIAFSSDGIQGFAVGDSSLILSSTDKGATWRTSPIQNPPIAEPLFTLGLLSGHDAFAIGSSGWLYQSSSSARVARQDEPTSVGIFPNPASDRVYVTLPTDFGDVKDVWIYDPLAREVMTWHPSDHQRMASINVSGLNTGLYFLRIKSLYSDVSSKLVIER